MLNILKNQFTVTLPLKNMTLSFFSSTVNQDVGEAASKKIDPIKGVKIVSKGSLPKITHNPKTFTDERYLLGVIGNGIPLNKAGTKLQIQKPVILHNNLNEFRI